MITLLSMRHFNCILLVITLNLDPWPLSFMLPEDSFMYILLLMSNMTTIANMTTQMLNSHCFSLISSPFSSPLILVIELGNKTHQFWSSSEISSEKLTVGLLVSGDHKM